MADQPAPLVEPGVASALTDGTGVSQLLGSKIIKDFLLDALLSAPISLAAINITGLEGALAAPLTVSLALGEALIRVAYRAALRALQTPA